MGQRGSVFTNFEELEFVAVELSSSRRRKNEERSKQSIENLAKLRRATQQAGAEGYPS
jgi:hypothetical protein